MEDKHNVVALGFILYMLQRWAGRVRATGVRVRGKDEVLTFHPKFVHSKVLKYTGFLLSGSKLTWLT